MIEIFFYSFSRQNVSRFGQQGNVALLPEVIKFIAARHFRPMVRLVKLHPLLAQSYKCLQALSFGFDL